ncbi:hypothetical protein [Glutamicibacter uratoxydans]|uniref:hypothetical protein n=1 Tax=Glutamicibacter uratoxydans TaxID=43667 RepID=UPI003D6F85D4
MSGELAFHVARFMGRGEDENTLNLIIEHVELVSAFVEAYTRGRGFTDGEPNKPLEKVIISATARLVDNPSQAKRQSAGAFSVTPAVLDGFTLPELAVLHRYRKRTQ